MKGLILDYGGTLDSDGMHWGKVIWHAYERCAIPVTETQYREAYVQTERRLGVENIIQPADTFHRTLAIKLAMQLQMLGVDTERYHKLLLDDIYGGVQQTMLRNRGVLETLKTRQVRMVLVTNFYGNMNRVLQEMGIVHLFHEIIESAVVGIRKPDSRLYQLGVDALLPLLPEGSTSRDITVVGDSMDKDIIPAKSIGCQTVWIKGEGWTDSVPDNAAADHTIDNLTELLSVFY